MNTRFRNTLGALLTVTALALSLNASAQVLRPGASDEVKQRAEQKQERREEARQQAELPREQAPRPSAPPSQAVQRPGGQRPPAAAAPSQRSYGTAEGRRQPNFVPRPGYRYDNDRGGRDGWRDDRNHRPPRVVQHLPSGYRDYTWNGNRYYRYGGHWYRPYGSSFISIGIPYGLFVSTLPGYYTSFWYGGSRYFYSDNTYYLYEPVQRGYVVTRSPYGDDEDEYADAGVDLYVYPARGQSEQQLADDRYECHQWAVKESRYDPLDDEYDADKREEYLRATTACLTGRGYTVN